MAKVVIGLGVFSEFLETTARGTDSDCLQTCQRKSMFVIAQTVLNTKTLDCMNAPPPMALLRGAVAERGRCQYRILTGLVDKSEWRSWLLTLCLRMAASKVSRRYLDGRMSPFCCHSDRHLTAHCLALWCLAGERFVVRKEIAPAGIVTFLAASMAVIFTGALYHSL